MFFTKCPTAACGADIDFATCFTGRRSACNEPISHPDPLHLPTSAEPEIRLTGDAIGSDERRNLGWRPARSQEEASRRMAAVSYCAGQRDARRLSYGFSTFPHRHSDVPVLSQKEADSFIATGQT